MIRYRAQELEDFYRRSFEAAGLDAERAETAAAGLAFADARGVATHGAANLERIYIGGLLDGRIDPAATPQRVVEKDAMALLDARRGLGLVAAAAAMDDAIDRARRHGVGVVGVRGSTHCGGLAFYTHRAVEAGMIGLAFSNLGAQKILRPPGGAEPMLGTNVLAAAAPTATNPPFSLDMSSAIVSTGRLRAAIRAGEQAPVGWLVDDQEEPVRDAQAYFDGDAHLQFLGGEMATGGYKGYGLALLVDILCGIFTGAQVGPAPARLRAEEDPEDSNIGHLLVALDIEAFRSPEAFTRGLDEMLDALLACPPAGGVGGVDYPGRHEYETADSGHVDLDDELVESLSRVAARLSVVPPVPMAEGVSA